MRRILHVRLALIVGMPALLLSMASHAQVVDNDDPPPDSIPPARDTYMGRTIATTMHYTGAPWLVRGSRAREEGTQLLLEQLDIQSGTTLCDMGCGNGYYTIPMARQTGEDGRVFAVDIQKPMLEMLEEAAVEAGVSNIEMRLGTVVDPRLPEASIDLMLVVDVYHEMSHPEEMLAAIRRSLTEDGRLVLVEFRAEDPSVPIKPLHKMSKKQILKELTANGFKLADDFDGLPMQHMMTFVLDPAFDTPRRIERVYKRIGEIELRLFIDLPAGRAPEGGRPAVVFFHGGGWRSGEPSQFFDQSEHLARRGLVGVCAEYRLGAAHGATPRECVADGKSALRWVRAHADELGIDPRRIAAGGGSAGGHVAAAIATTDGFDDEPDSPVSCRPDALILFNPVFDNGPGGWGHDRVKDYWKSISPLHNLSAATPPSLVMLGTKDALVPVETARRWKARLDEVAVRCVLELYEDQPHGFFNRTRNEAMYEATLSAMDAFLNSLDWR